REVLDTPGLEPITVDFALERGVEVTGRLMDAAGKPVRGVVDYKPFLTNPNLKDYPSLGTSFSVGDWDRTGPDGTFTVLAVPGPGVVIASADTANRFRILDLVPEFDETSGINGVYARPVHAAERINPDPADRRTLRHDITLEPGRTLKGSVVGSDG